MFGVDGSVLGLVAAPDHMILAFNIQRALNQAIARLQTQTAGVEASGGGGGGKWVWIGGAGAAAALGAVLLGGGGDDGGGGTPQATTGGIEIIIPGGTP